MDEDDVGGYESQPDAFSEPVTERVRIIGADPVGTPAGEVVGDRTPSPLRAEAASGPAVENLEGDPAGRLSPRWLDDDDGFDETTAAELPHWSDPPTGQVPAVLERRREQGSGSSSWSSSGDTGPAWREHTHEWDEGGFEPSLLADESTRVGALDELPLEQRQPWEFDDLRTPPGGTSLPRASTRERPPTGSPPLEGAAVTTSRPPAVPVAPAVDPGPAHDSEAEAPVVGSTDNGVPSISSSPLRADPLAPAGTTGPRRRRRPAGGGGPRGGRASGVGVRVATGIGLAALALVCFSLGALATLVLAVVVVTLASAEGYAAFRRAGRHPATLLGLVATAAVVVAAYAKGVAALPLVAVLLIITSMVWYLVGAERGSPVAGIASTVLGFVWVGLLGSFAGLLLAPSLYPERHGVAFFFGAVVATVAADVGALVIGAWRGRHLLAPRVSPHKTWEGVVGGAVFAVLASAAITGQMHPWTPGKAAVLGAVVAVLAPVGDLCESLIKRDLGLKDMGSILPGHGGLLDRVDGLLFVLPATYYLVRVLHLG